jgi:hypothetical protein
LARIPDDPRRYEVDEMLAAVARHHTETQHVREPNRATELQLALETVRCHSRPDSCDAEGVSRSFHNWWAPGRRSILTNPTWSSMSLMHAAFGSQYTEGSRMGCSFGPLTSP